MGKVYEASTLLAYAKDRVQAYKAFDEQLEALKKALHTVATLDNEFQGKGADSIKGFYTSQVDVVTHWKSLVSSHQSYFNSIADYAEQAKLKGDTVVDVSFLEQELAVANDRSKQMVEQQHAELESILSNIDDIIHITPFSTDAIEDDISAAEKKRTDTITAVEELDNQLSSEYGMLDSFYESVQFSVNSLEQMTSQGGSAYQLVFDANAYKNSEAYKTQQQIDKVASGYVEGKTEQKQQIKAQKEAIEAEKQRQIQANKPWYEKGLDIAGELIGYNDYKRAVEGVDPVTHKKLSATQRVTAGAMAAAGFIPFVGWAGRALKGGSVVYKTAKGMSAAHHAMALYQTPKTFKVLEQTEKGLYGLVLTNGMYEYTIGKDVLGNKLTKEEQQASLFQSFGIATGGVLASKASTQLVEKGAQAVTKRFSDMRNVVRTSKVTQYGKDIQQSMRNMPVPGIDKAKKMYDTVLNTKLPKLAIQEVPIGVSPAFAQQTVRDVLKNTAKNTIQFISNSKVWYDKDAKRYRREDTGQFTRDPNRVDKVEQKPVESVKAREEGLGVEETKGQLTTGNRDAEVPPAFRQTEFASSYEARLKQTPAPINPKVEFEGIRGESLCTLKPPPDPKLKRILDEAGIEGIQYKNGVPDFSPVSKAQVEINYMLGGKANYGGKARVYNFAQADQKLADQLNNSSELARKFGMEPGGITAKDIDKYRTKNKLTWHEVNDVKIIQLVPTEINKRFGHLGGVGEINAGAFEPKGFAKK